MSSFHVVRHFVHIMSFHAYHNCFIDERTKTHRVTGNTPFHPTSKCWSSLTSKPKPLIPAVWLSWSPGCSSSLATPFYLVLLGGLPRLSFSYAECSHQGSLFRSQGPQPAAEADDFQTSLLGSLCFPQPQAQTFSSLSLALSGCP